MKKIEKLILSGVIIGFGTIFNLFFTAALHGLLSRQYDRLTLILCSSVFQGFSRSSGSYSCFCPLRDLSGCAVSSFGCRMTGLIRVI